ncbi:MAG: hypothetical protein AAGH15_15215 [Myxococcota bacterium]
MDTTRRLRHTPLLLAVALVACGDGDESGASADAGTDPVDAGMDTGADDAGADDDRAYVVGSRIRTPDGRVFFATLVPDLAARELDLSTSLELSGFARSYAFDGSLFTMDSESLQIVRHDVAEDLSIREADRFSMAGLGFRRFNLAFVFLDPERALYVDDENYQVVRWNPREMALDGMASIDELIRDDFELDILSLHPVGDRVLVPFAWTLIDDFRLIPTVNVAILDATTGELLGVAEDDRCAAAGGGFVGPEGDLYVIGDNGAGVYGVFGDNDLGPPCLLRIRAGEDDFDPDYYVDLRALTGAAEVARITGLPNGQAAVRAVLPEVDPDSVDNPIQLTLAEIWDWTLIDVTEPSARSLGIPPSAATFPPFTVDDQLVLIREAFAGFSTFYLVDDGVVTESVTADGELLQLGRIR